MALVQAILYLLAVFLLFLAAIGVVSTRVSLALLGACAALLAFSLPVIAAGFA